MSGKQTRTFASDHIQWLVFTCTGGCTKCEKISFYYARQIFADGFEIGRRMQTSSELLLN